MSSRSRKQETGINELSRRDLMRRAGMFGVGALGLGVLGCKGRPDEDVVDLGTNPQLLQVGGTITGTLRGLLTGAAAAGVSVRFLGLGEITTDEAGNFEVRVQRAGDYDVVVQGTGYYRREGRARLAGNLNLAMRILESGQGLTQSFIDQYARGLGSDKEGIRPRTPGQTNRWQSTPSVRIYRRLSDDDKGVIPDARLSAMQASIQSLFGPLTGFGLGSAVSIDVRSTQPPADLGEVPRNVIVIGQRRGGGLLLEHTGSLDNPWAIRKARTECGVDSTIEIFNRMFAHTLGAWVTTTGDSIVNPAGRSTPSARDLQAASFLYARVPGNEAPDRDPAGVYLNA